jgi:hypothetical protein
MALAAASVAIASAALVIERATNGHSEPTKASAETTQPHFATARWRRRVTARSPRDGVPKRWAVTWTR